MRKWNDITQIPEVHVERTVERIKTRVEKVTDLQKIQQQAKSTIDIEK